MSARLNADTSALSARLAEHIAQVRYEDLPASTVMASKRAILDGIGVMLAASGSSDDVKPFVHWAQTCGGSAQADILGFGTRVSAPMAALANGAMAHALDFEDAFDAAPLHPNASLLPAALAVAQLKAPVSGREFIRAVAVGCDLVCRIGLSLRRPMEAGGWYPPPIIGAFGATAAAAMLLKLSPRQILDAFSLLLCQNSCAGEIKYSSDTVIRAVREAFPAQAAVNCAALAAHGVRGFDAPFEGRSGFFALFVQDQYDAGDLLDSLGKRYWIDELSLKKWPCCRGTHAFIEAAQVLRQAHRFELDDIETLLLSGGEELRMLCEPVAQKMTPRTLIDAKFSLPFVVAAALLHDEIKLGSFTAASLQDPQLLKLTARAQFDPQPQWQNNAAGGGLTLILRDGRRLYHGVAQALGDASRPLPIEALRTKFIDCAGLAAMPLSRQAATTMADRILALDREADAGALLSGR
jgi:2-methylcitrate dehydratase PrpD